MKPTNPPKTYRVKSFGCQMNVYDGERMGELLAAQGITPAPEGEDADLVVLNTCHIREKATEKVYSDIGRLRREDGSSPLIAVAGYVAQAREHQFDNSVCLGARQGQRRDRCSARLRGLLEPFADRLEVSGSVGRLSVERARGDAARGEDSGSRVHPGSVSFCARWSREV